MIRNRSIVERPITISLSFAMAGIVKVAAYSLTSLLSWVGKLMVISLFPPLNSPAPGPHDVYSHNNSLSDPINSTACVTRQRQDMEDPSGSQSLLHVEGRRAGKSSSTSRTNLAYGIVWLADPHK